MSLAFHGYSANCTKKMGSQSDVCGVIHIDLDGPNSGASSWAIDRFEFWLTKDGIVPGGTGENPSSSCFIRGSHCETYIMDNCP